MKLHVIYLICVIVIGFFYFKKEQYLRALEQIVASDGLSFLIIGDNLNNGNPRIKEISQFQVVEILKVLAQYKVSNPNTDLFLKEIKPKSININDISDSELDIIRDYLSKIGSDLPSSLQSTETHRPPP